MSDDNAQSADRPSLQPQRRLGPQPGVRNLQPQRPSSSSASSSAPAPAPAPSASLPPRASGPILPKPQPQRPKSVRTEDAQAPSPRTPVEDETASPGPAEEAEDEYVAPADNADDGDDTKEDAPKARHPLENSWTFWFDKRAAPARGGGPHGSHNSREFKEYENNLRHVGEFDTVEDFWRYFNNMKKPGDLEVNSNYHLFKSGIKPMWEDKENLNGGKWTVILKKDRRNLDDYWQNLVMAVIGEVLDEGNDVCGCVLSRRGAGDRISLWNKNKEDSAAIMKLGKKLKQCFMEGTAPSSELALEYSFHKESIKTGTSRASSAAFVI